MNTLNPVLNPVVAQVTRRITARSATERGVYLERMAAEAQRGPARGRLACANLAQRRCGAVPGAVPAHRHH